eukprot:Nk52_evm9s274 gene=Nk52_evmTU9s274
MRNISVLIVLLVYTILLLMCNIDKARGFAIRPVRYDEGAPLIGYNKPESVAGFNLKGFALKFCDEYIGNLTVRASETWDFAGGDDLYHNKALQQYLKIPNLQKSNVLFIEIYNHYRFSSFIFQNLNCGNITVETAVNKYHLKMTFNDEMPPNSTVTFGASKKKNSYTRIFDNFFCGDVQCSGPTSTSPVMFSTSTTSSGTPTIYSTIFSAEPTPTVLVSKTSFTAPVNVRPTGTGMVTSIDVPTSSGSELPSRPTASTTVTSNVPHSVSSTSPLTSVSASEVSSMTATPTGTDASATQMESMSASPAGTHASATESLSMTATPTGTDASATQMESMSASPAGTHASATESLSMSATPTGTDASATQMESMSASPAGTHASATESLSMSARPTGTDASATQMESMSASPAGTHASATESLSMTARPTETDASAAQMESMTASPAGTHASATESLSMTATPTGTDASATQIESMSATPTHGASSLAQSSFGKEIPLTTDDLSPSYSASTIYSAITNSGSALPSMPTAIESITSSVGSSEPSTISPTATATNSKMLPQSAKTAGSMIEAENVASSSTSVNVNDYLKVINWYDLQGWAKVTFELRGGSHVDLESGTYRGLNSGESIFADVTEGSVLDTTVGSIDIYDYFIGIRAWYSPAWINTGTTNFHNTQTGIDLKGGATGRLRFVQYNGGSTGVRSCIDLMLKLNPVGRANPANTNQYDFLLNW